jgi:hypothetical protein
MSSINVKPARSEVRLRRATDRAYAAAGVTAVSAHKRFGVSAKTANSRQLPGGPAATAYSIFLCTLSNFANKPHGAEKEIRC